LELLGPDAREGISSELAIPRVAFLEGPTLLDSRAVLEIFAELQHERSERRRRRRQREAGGAVPGSDRSRRRNSRQAAPKLGQLHLEEVAARIDRVRAASIGFVERLVTFWTNHFAVASLKLTREVFGLVGPFEREAIRPHVLGHFEDMLLAATKHPAMLSYLNNKVSVGPNSPLGLREKEGLNENHARELLELHTVGVNGGYSQADVTSLARILTGWTFGQKGKNDGPPGEFYFNPSMHEPGIHGVLGVSYAQSGLAQGEAVLADLARRPETARHIAKKLARHFIADNHPVELENRLASVFLESGGDLKAVAIALVTSDAAWIPRNKIKLPQEFLWSAIRALQIQVPPSLAISMLTSLGQPLWNPPSPEGFKDDSATWLASDAIKDRLEVASQLAQSYGGSINPSDLTVKVCGPDVSPDTRDIIARAESDEQGISLLLMSHEFQRR